MKKYVCFLTSNSHIDVAWLWSTEETKIVCYKTFSHVIKLMQKYPELKFAQSSALFYMWLEKYYPKLFKRIVNLVKRRQWEIVGGFLVEFDANMPQGESIVRQFLLGKRYFLGKFNVDVKVCFIPDTFGFPISLPQILRKAGIKYFVTTKLLWNDVVLYPYHIFRWIGIDGTKILAYQGVSGYDTRLINAKILIDQIKKMIKTHGIPLVLILFGKGDHGGGPSALEIENIRNWRKQFRKIDIKCSFMQDFFETVQKFSNKIPEWKDELYLQFHRGVFTVQSLIKYLNRKCENLLLDLEKILVLARTILKDDFAYPKEKIKELWIELLTNQFHDILCGSLSQDAYNEAVHRYIGILKIAYKMLYQALRKISEKTGGIIVVNSLNWIRNEFVKLRIKKEYVPMDENGIIPYQILWEKENAREILAYVKDIPPCGFKIITLEKEKEARIKKKVFVKESQKFIVLENKYLKVKISKTTGRITEIILKKRDFNILKAPITIRIHKDKPTLQRQSVKGVKAYLFDAWELFVYDQKIPEHIDLIKPKSINILEVGPLRAIVRVIYEYKQRRRKSKFNVFYIILAEKPYLEIKFIIDWHAKHRYAQFLVPLNLNFEGITYEVPYGVIYRRNPFARNVSVYEKAKYEVPALRWLDAYDKKKNIGVSIINDSKYGFGQRNSAIHVSLLRAPVFPSKAFFFSKISEKIFDIMGNLRRIRKRILEKIFDVVCLYLAEILGFHVTDQGRHKIRIVIYPHEGDWREANTPEIAAEVNHPVYVLRTEYYAQKTQIKKYCLIQVEPSSVHICAIKEHEDLPLIVIRLFETRGKQTDVKIKVNYNIEQVWLLDLIERKVKKINVKGNEIALKLNPFEITTIGIKLRK